MSPVGQENRSKHLTHRKSHFLTGTDFMPLTPPVSPTPTQTLFSTSCSDIFSFSSHSPFFMKLT